MIAYKGMCPGMVCLGYQLKMGLNVTEQANCQANGFHCAANPMDCLRYYGDFQNSEYYLVRPCGDLDEDAVALSAPKAGATGVFSACACVYGRPSADAGWL